MHQLLRTQEVIRPLHCDLRHSIAHCSHHCRRPLREVLESSILFLQTPIDASTHNMQVDSRLANLQACTFNKIAIVSMREHNFNYLSSQTNLHIDNRLGGCASRADD